MPDITEPEILLPEVCVFMTVIQDQALKLSPEKDKD